MISNLCLSQSDESFNNFQVGIFNFSVEPSVKIKKFAKKISLSRIPSVFSYDSSKHGRGDENFLGYKFSVIYRRVQRLLNMYPIKLKKLNVRVYKSIGSIAKYLKGHSGGKSPQVFNKRAPAFFHVKSNTLHISYKGFDEYVFAHEIAHVIISHYFVIAPPPKIHELLAMYCDEHLKDSSL